MSWIKEKLHSIMEVIGEGPGPDGTGNQRVKALFKQRSDDDLNARGAKRCPVCQGVEPHKCERCQGWGAVRR